MSPEEMRRARLSQQILSQLAESTGRRYVIELMRLDERSLMALHQALRELQDTHQSALRRARTRL